MGRLLILLGVILLVVGVALPFISSTGFLRGIGGIQNTVTATAEELCNPGEKLIEEGGAAGRTGTSDFGTGRTVTYYCENEAGVRRDVSEKFYNQMLTGVGGIFGSVGTLMTGGLAGMGVSVVGVLLLIFGIILTVRRRPRQMAAYTVNLQQGNPMILGNRGQMADFVRQQLDAAYQNGQISREQYDAALEKLNRQQ
ncbi:MAG: hypothetical protein KF726_12070 [Anaerolineae bacterium]|nr:hypothetical protein [Anaerolineae bacterium]